MLSGSNSCTNKSTAIISLPLVWSIRNFILSGITTELSKIYDIYYAVDEDARDLILEYNIPNDKIIIIRSGKRIPVLPDFLRLSFLKIHPELRYLKDIMSSAGIFPTIRGIKSRIKNRAFSLISYLLTINAVFKAVEWLWLYLSGLIVDKQLQEDIKRIKPEFILSTTIVVGIEFPLIFIARKLKIPIYTHILSFDNITSRGYLPLSHFDKYLVWNQKMKDELMHYYNVDSSKIVITGTPQFDYHNDAGYVLPRSQALTMLRLDPSDIYILYCANHIHISPQEPQLLDDILTFFRTDDFFNSLKIILRLHPLDHYERWDSLLYKYKNKVSLSIPWDHPVKGKPALGVVTQNDMKVFVNQLKYAELVLNIASTIAIDAAVSSTPVICIGFHTRDEKESKCYYDYHFSEHYKPIMSQNCIPLAKNMDDLHKLILKNLNNTNDDKTCLEKITSYFLGDETFSSKERILNTLLDKV